MSSGSAPLAAQVDLVAFVSMTYAAVLAVLGWFWRDNRKWKDEVRGSLTSAVNGLAIVVAAGQRTDNEIEQVRDDLTITNSNAATLAQAVARLDERTASYMRTHDVWADEQRKRMDRHVENTHGQRA